MLFAASLLALTLVGTPSHPCVTPTQTGIFRITATTTDSSNASVGLVLLENINDCLEASIMAESGGPSIIEEVSLKGDLLTGRVHLAGGLADVSLRVSALDISGSIVAGKQAWIVSGHRTAGTEARSAAGDLAATRKP